MCKLFKIEFELRRKHRIEKWTGFTYAPTPEEAVQKVRTHWRIGDIIYRLTAEPLTELAPVTTWKDDQFMPSALVDKWVCTGYKLKSLTF